MLRKLDLRRRSIVCASSLNFVLASLRAGGRTVASKLRKNKNAAIGAHEVSAAKNAIGGGQPL